MKYLRLVIPAALLSTVFGFVLPDYQVSIVGGFTGFLITIALGTAFSLVYHGYKAMEPRMVRRFSGKKLRPEHTFYIGLVGLTAVSTLLLVGVSAFTGLLVLGGWIGAIKAGLCLTLLGTAVVPPPSLFNSSADAATKPAPQPAPEPTPVEEPAAPADTAAAGDTAAPIGVPVSGVAAATGTEGVVPVVTDTPASDAPPTTDGK